MTRRIDFAVPVEGDVRHGAWPFVPDGRATRRLRVGDASSTRCTQRGARWTRRFGTSERWCVPEARWEPPGPIESPSGLNAPNEP